MAFHSQALELSDEETGGGRALSCVPLLISTWPRQAEEGEGTLIRLQPLQHTSHGYPGEKTGFMSYKTLPFSRGPSQKGPSSPSPTPHPPMCVLGPTSHFGNLGLSYGFFVCFACLFLCVCGYGCLANTQNQGPHSKLEPFTFVSLFFPSSGAGGCGGQEAAFPEDRAAGAAAIEQLLCLAPLFSIIKIQFQNFCLEQFPKEPMKDAKRVGPFSSGRVSAEGRHWPSCPRLCSSGAEQWTVSKTECCAHLD